jgi:methionyl-tRNA formyltransferase
MPEGISQVLKILKAQAEPSAEEVVPGNFFTDGKTFLKVGCKNGFIQIKELQLSGRKAMNSVDFLRGFHRIFSETRAK